jgi:hypothetical protein
MNESQHDADREPERLTPEIAPTYSPPEVIEVGMVGRLVNGEQGKHTDSYTGYYWNGEG